MTHTEFTKDIDSETFTKAVYYQMVKVITKIGDVTFSKLQEQHAAEMLYHSKPVATVGDFVSAWNLANDMKISSPAVQSVAHMNIRALAAGFGQTAGEAMAARSSSEPISAPTQPVGG